MVRIYWMVCCRRRGPRRPCRAACFGGIHEVTQLFAGLEEGNPLRCHFHFGARLGVTSRARIALPSTETANAANLYLVPCLERVDHGVEEGVHDDFAVAASKVAQGSDAVNEIGFGHGKYSL